MRFQAAKPNSEMCDIYFSVLPPRCLCLTNSAVLKRDVEMFLVSVSIVPKIDTEEKAFA